MQRHCYDKHLLSVKQVLSEQVFQKLWIRPAGLLEGDSLALLTYKSFLWTGTISPSFQLEGTFSRFLFIDFSAAVAWLKYSRNISISVIKLKMVYGLGFNQETQEKLRVRLSDFSGRSVTSFGCITFCCVVIVSAKI